MTKEELREHCEKQVKACEMWAEARDEEPSGKIYEEHKLILDLIKALEQQPSEDCVSRAEALMTLTGTNLSEKSADELIALFDKRIRALPLVRPTFPKGATNYDVLKTVFGSISAFRIKDTMEFEKGFEFWFSKPYKRGDLDGSN